MGQSTSSHSKKNIKNYYGSALFGYTKSVQYMTIKQTDEIEDTSDESVLFKSFLYGLENNDSQASVTATVNESSSSRADSGFLLYDKNSQLWNDLTYIDSTYYQKNNATQTTLATIAVKNEEKDSHRIALNFHDVYSMCQRSMQVIDLSKRGLASICSNIAYLHVIRRLEVSYNYLTEIPKEIGYLTQLEYLSVSNNQIQIIPGTICNLFRLAELNISNNQIQALPSTLYSLPKLQYINASYNQITHVSIRTTEEQANGGCLANVDFSYNPIAILPAEITRLPFLRRLRLDGCPLVETLDQFPLVHQPPSLLEICARSIVQENTATTATKLKAELTESLHNYILDYKICSHCHGPYFDAYVSRGKWIERNEAWIPLEYRLCSAHWSNESDRFYSLFASSIQPAVPLLGEKELDILPPLLPSKVNYIKSGPSVLSSLTVREQEQPPTFASAMKRWKFKVRNNSLFFKYQYH